MKRASIRRLITLIILIALVCMSPTFADKRADKVDRLFSPWDRPDSPGCALAVIQDGRIIHKRGYGMANLEHKIPITPRSLFYIGSVSKQFVAFSIALLATRGKLSLDDDIRKYIPEMPDYGTPITIRHLIHHTSGLRDYLTLEDIAGIPFGTYHEKDVIELIALQKELNFRPGEEYLYSNSGYLLLSVIIQRASGKTLREFAEENIFGPLGMKSSRFHDDYRELIENRASGYYPAAKGKFWNFISTFDCVGSGGLYTCVEDLYLWDQNFYHHRVGGQEVIDLVHTRGILNSGRTIDYAFGLRLGEYKGLKTVSHSGALGGYRAALLRFPEQRFSVICLSNLSTFNSMAMARKVADIYLAGRFKEEAESKEEKKKRYIRLPSDKLKEKVGAYIDRKTGFIRRVSLEKRRLFLQVSGRKYPLAALSETEFQMLESPTRTLIRFEKPEKEGPMRMIISVEGEKPITYEAFREVKLSPVQLKEYEGPYFSDELQVTFHLALKKERLHVVHRNAPVPPLRPTLRDWFSVRGWTLHFIRDENGKIIAFTLNAGRVRNLRFERKS
ncbi:MAG: serine hydrolase domain-containing protein [Candidatus Aminicenantales bacterium]